MASLEHLKVGDKVAYYTSNFSDGYWNVVEITGETPTQWKTGETRWRKSDGKSVGESSVWHSRRIVEMTEERAAEIRESQRRRRHKDLWRKIQMMKQPSRVAVERLEEIYNELSGPATDSK